MSWQYNIFNKYNLEEKGVKIISDFTDVLLHPSFLNFLSEQEKPYFIASSIPDMLDKLNHADIVILCEKLDIPSFISNKTETFVFRLVDIPFNGNTQLLADHSPEEMVSVFEYLQENDPHYVFSETGLPGVLAKAKEHLAKKELKVIRETISDILAKDLSLNNILHLSQVWAELQYQSYKSGDSTFLELSESIDNYSTHYFEESIWQEAFYASASHPKTVDKLLHKIRMDKANKKALLCFDCMGLPEWLLLKDYLSDLKLDYEETQVFSLIPSITSIARSSIFAGTYDVCNKPNPGQASEEKDFKAFFGEEKTLYLRDKDFATGEVLLGYETVSLLFNFFDDLSHSAVLQESSLNKFNYYNTVLDHLKNSNVKQIFKELLKQDFTIYICSDHGSTIACGNGKRIDKYLCETNAKRAAIISKDSAELTGYIKINIPFVADKVVVIPEKREMFANKNQYEINHGGTTIEEMVVPFIKVK
jgi:hypothetical protein